MEAFVFRKVVTSMLPAIAILATCSIASADCEDCNKSESCGTKTVCQRQYVTEMKTVTCTEYKKETREKTYKVMKRVPRTEERTRTVTECVPETRTKTVNYTVNKKVMETRSCDYQVQVPY
ncbi:MAG TPA: hypothetical protein DD662_05010, partial [Planctomycetaceae bacterium]|nr:hypothetical protein [Planctomycetaceae bacterium]